MGAAGRMVEARPTMALVDNPVFRAELRRLRARPAGWCGRLSWAPARRWLPGVSLAWVAVLIAAPYVLQALGRMLSHRYPLGPVGPAAILPWAPGLYLLFLGRVFVVVGPGLLLAPGLLLRSSLSLTRDRNRQTLDDILLTRLTAGEVITGRAAALLLPAALTASLCYLAWLLFPPVSGELNLLLRRFPGPLWLPLVLLWADTLVCLTAVAFASMGASVAVKSAGGAVLSAVSAAFVPVWLVFWQGFLFGLTFLLSWPTGLPVSPVQHGLWLLAWGAWALVNFRGAQSALNPVPAPMDLLPPGILRRRVLCPRMHLFRRGKVVGVALLVAAFAGLVVYAVTEPETREIEQRAESYMISGKYRQALSLLDHGLRGPYDGFFKSTLWDGKALCHRRLGEYPQALAAHRRKIERAETVTGRMHAYLAMGDTLAEMGRAEAARDAYRQALETGRAALRDAREFAPLCAPSLQVLFVDAAQWLLATGYRAGSIEACDMAAGGPNRAEAGFARHAAAILRGGLESTPMLGISLHTGSARVARAGAAAGAGLRAGDRIVSVAGKPVSDGLTIRRALAGHRAGDTVAVVIERAGKRVVMRLRLEPARPLFRKAADPLWGRGGLSPAP